MRNALITEGVLKMVNPTYSRHGFGGIVLCGGVTDYSRVCELEDGFLRPVKGEC